MSKHHLFQFKIVDNSDTIVHDIWQNPQYYNEVYRGVVDRNEYDIIFYKKCLVPSQKYIDLINKIEDLPSKEWKNILPTLFKEIANIEGFENELLLNEIFKDYEYSEEYINEEWRKFRIDYSLSDIGEFYWYSKIIATLGDKILLSSNDYYEIEDSFTLSYDRSEALFEDTVMTRFYRKLVNFDASKVEALLNYHIDKYTGEKKVFLDKLDDFLDIHRIDRNTTSIFRNFYYHVFPNLLTNELMGKYEVEPYQNYRITKNWIANKRIQIAIPVSKNERPKTKGLTTKQQVLILHYLDLLGGNWGLSSQRKFIKFLSKFFGVHNDTVKEGILNKCVASKTKENLDVVRELFEEFGLPTDKIVRDIDEIEN